eukprot:scpid33951/ scgid22636/ Fibrillin-3
MIRLSNLPCTHLSCPNVILIVLAITMWSVTPLVSSTVQSKCVLGDDRHLTVSKENIGGLEVFKWATWHPTTKPHPQWQNLSGNNVTAVFEFPGNCRINVSGIEYNANHACQFVVFSEDIYDNGSSTKTMQRQVMSEGRGLIKLALSTSTKFRITFNVLEMTESRRSCMMRLTPDKKPFIGLFFQEDINECDYVHNPCDDQSKHGNTPTCINTWGSYECSCEEGYEPVQHEDEHRFTCNDIDECAKSNNPCYGYYYSDHEPYCENTMGSYRCFCNNGYEHKQHWNDIECKDKDECSEIRHLCNQPSNQGSGKCVNTPGSYYCNCSSGYSATPTSNGTLCRVLSTASPTPTQLDKDLKTVAARTSLRNTTATSTSATHLGITQVPRSPSGKVRNDKTLLVTLSTISVILIALLVALTLRKRENILKLFQLNSIALRPTAVHGHVNMVHADRTETEMSLQQPNRTLPTYTGTGDEYTTVPVSIGIDQIEDHTYSLSTAPTAESAATAGMHSQPPNRMENVYTLGEGLPNEYASVPDQMEQNVEYAYAIATAPDRKCDDHTGRFAGAVSIGIVERTDGYGYALATARTSIPNSWTTPCSSRSTSDPTHVSNTSAKDQRAMVTRKDPEN